MTLTDIDFLTRLAVGAGCGALIGLERQWRARNAGLRTNTLVSTGSTLFVLYSVAVGDPSPTRVASYVVSGIGFLGGGAILRDGFTVRGLNTAATIWCSAATGCLAAAGYPRFALYGAITVLLVHLLLRPVGRAIDSTPVGLGETEQQTTYELIVIVRRKSEPQLRAQLLQSLTGTGFVLLGLSSRHLVTDPDLLSTGQGASQVEVRARLLSDTDATARLEQLLSRLSLETGVRAVSWHAADPRIPDEDAEPTFHAPGR